MYLKSIKFFQFRNLLDQTVLPSRGVNFLIGRNGQGKTNVVEGIHLLSHGRSFRTNDTEELLRWNCSEASVFSEIGLEDQDRALYTLGLSFKKGAREAFLNGEKLVSLASFLGRCLCVTFTPTDLALVKGSPQHRRRFLDKHLIDCDPTLANNFFAYHRALKSKSKLLKNDPVDAVGLDICDDTIAKESATILEARRAFLKKLELRASICLQTICQDDGRLGLKLDSNVGAEERSAAAIRERLAAERRREIKFRSCLIGPHRDDVIISFAGHDARSFASQGQARSIVLALKIALVGLIEEARHEAPILVLDDFDSELDAGRRETIFKEVYRSGRQVFVTGTNNAGEGVEHTSERAFFKVKEGLVTGPFTGFTETD